MSQVKPDDWKSYDEFAAGIATNRLPMSDALIGQSYVIQTAQEQWHLRFEERHLVQWANSTGTTQQGVDWCEVIEVASDTYFVDITFSKKPLHALTVILNTRNLRVLLVPTEVRSAEMAGAQPRVAQQFIVGTLGTDVFAATGIVPHESRDLIGMRTWQTYSPQHTYEHTYLSSERYCWQCLVGVQRGHGDVDLATYYKFDEDQYIFTFREFLIPVASVFFFNFETMRSTGKFLGLTGAGAVQNSPAGALMRIASQTIYTDTEQPV